MIATVVGFSFFFFFEYESTIDKLIMHRCKKNYSNKIDEKLKKRKMQKCKNAFNFSNNGINKFILLLGKGVYPYEYLNEREQISKTSFPKMKNFIVT